MRRRKYTRRSTISIIITALVIAFFRLSGYSISADDLNLPQLTTSANANQNQGNVVKGKVVKVYDGDTITLLDTSNNQLKIRFSGIDAPERKQAFGEKSRDYLASMIAGKTVEVKVKEKDKYGRYIGTVYSNNKDINLEMLKGGYAWHYSHYDNQRSYQNAMNDAKARKLGLWRDKNATAPWNFRRNEKS